MFSLRRFCASSAIVAISLFGVAVTAQAADPLRVRGTLTAVSAEAVTVHTRSGDDLQVALGPDTRFSSVAKTDLTAIAPDSWIGTAAAPQPDGTLKALEVHIFPPSMRGAGEGTRPWDSQPGSTMTNGAVGNIVGSNGRTLTVKYQNGEKQVFVPPDVPVVALSPADRSVLMVGAKVVLLAGKAADGALTALSVSVGANGLTPPM